MKKLAYAISVLLFSFVLTGCMALKPDSQLLRETNNSSPKVNSSYVLDTSINSAIERQATGKGIRELVDESIRISLKNANIFKLNSNSEYKISAYIEQASQSTFSFGKFKGKLQINYIVKDPKGKIIYKNSIYTEAGSDRWYFAGQKRHTRSRIVNVAKNVNQFVKELNSEISK